MVIKAKRIYEPKKDDNFDIQKVLWEAIQKSINSSTDQTKTLVSEFERMSSDAGVKKLEEKFYQYIKNLRIEKEEIKQDVYKSIEDRVKNIGQRIENHDHKEYLTQEDKDECINSATDMVNEAVTRFDNLFNPFIEQLKIKANKDHSHEEFEELKKEIEENEQELENKIEQKADKKHKHEIEDVSWLSETLNNFAKTDHKHDEYATREELSYIQMNRGGWWWAHVIQWNGSVANQRGNINFIGATVTDDPSNNATVVTVTWWGGWASSYEVTQTAHWFVDTNWLYFDETDDTYKKAQSDSVDTLWSWHVVEVVDANTFKIAKEWVHEIPNTLDLWEYVLSQDTAWGYTQTLPWDLWDYVLYWMEVLSWTHISFYIVPAIPVLDTWWGSGTVTSVAISWSDWLEVDSGSPITTTGTIALWVNKTAMLIHLNVEDWADLTDATNVASAWAFMKATDDTDDITEGATNLFMDSTEQGKLANITVTQAVDLDQMEIDIAALANWMVYKWNRDASAWTFPWGWIAQTGRFYTVSVGGTVNSVVFGVDDRLVATADNASTTIYAWNWTKLDATDAVTTVNGAVGNVVLTKTDVGLSNVVNADTTTTANITDSLNKRFLTDAQEAIVDATSWNNTWDVTLAWTPNYLTILWQVITRTLIDLGSHVTWNLPVTNLNGWTWASSSTYWRGDWTWSSIAWSGAVMNSDYTTAHSILVQQSWTWSPTPLSIGNNTLVGRLSWGGSDIDDLSTTDVRTLLSISNVDNTSDATKNSATATLTNKTLTSPILTTPVLWTPASWNLSSCTADWTDAVWFRNIPQNSKSAAYTLVLADSGKHIYHPSADTTPRIWTIPANSSVAYPIGTAITFVNDTSAWVITIAITTDTLVLAWAGTTGSRTLAANGVATAIKITSTRRIINWTGLT